MSLKNLKSLYDRNTYGIEGNTPENTTPGGGNYFTDKGANDSPFASQKGNDHMVSLLTRKVTSANTGENYNPSPNKSEFQDLNGNPGPQFQLGRVVASQKHIDSLTKTSTYTHGNSTEVVGPVPGGDSNSPFNDINGDIVNNTGPSFADAGGAGKKLGGKDLHEALLTKSYTYSHAPGFSTTVLGENERGKQGGTFDLDGNKGSSFQGSVKIGPKPNLHTDLLSEMYQSKVNPLASYGAGQPGGTWPNVQPSPLASTPFADLNGGFASANSPLGQFGGPYKSTGPTEGYY